MRTTFSPRPGRWIPTGVCVIVWLGLAALAPALAPVLAAGRQTPDRVAVDPPRTVSLTLLETPRNRQVLGDLIAYDEASVTLKIKEETQTFAWRDITSTSAFIARYRLIDERSPTDWMALAAFGRAVGAEGQAERAIQQALRLDASLTEEAARIRALPLNSLRQPPESESEAVDATELNQPDPAELMVQAPPEVLTKFQPVSAEAHEAAMTAARQEAEASARKLGIWIREIETPHFLIFTDWDPVDDVFLIQSLEHAYRLVSSEFGIPYEQNVFIGKLPVYMFDSHDLFMRYAVEIDGRLEFRPTIAGYYSGRSDGMGKMAMSKPRQTRNVGPQVARQAWARTLTHEFAHAFFARYKSNAFMPRWLNEGLAELISEQVYARPGGLETARRIARREQSIAHIFDDRKMPSADYYPVMMTLVQALQAEDPVRFGRFIDRLKAGEEAEAVLREMYGVDYAGLEQAWRAHMRRR